MKQFLCIACALGCMVFLSCVKKDSNPTAVPSVFISEVRTVSGVSATTFTGKTKAVSEVNLAFRVAGQIERILVKEGDYVNFQLLETGKGLQALQVYARYGDRQLRLLCQRFQRA